MAFAIDTPTMETEMNGWDRREFLKAAGIMMSVPLLESIPSIAHAQQGPIQRLIIVYAIQGMPQQHWRPITRPDGGYDLNDIFQEAIEVDGRMIRLADFKDEMTLISGVDVRSAIDQPGNAHNLAAGHSLVGNAMDDAGPNEDPTLSGGPSIDHVISGAITDPSVAMRTLHLGVRSPWEICFTGAAQPVGRLTEPNEIIDSLFGDFTNPDTSGLARIRRRKRSVLDATIENITSLRRKLSAADRHRMDEYLERVREIERRLNANTIRGEACIPLSQMPLQPSPLRRHDPQVDYFHPYYDPDVATPTMIDVLVESLACDRTRVATLTLGDNSIWHWLRDRNGDVIEAKATGDWHQDVVHAYWGQNEEGSNATGNSLFEDQLRRVARWEHSMLAYLLAKLQNRNEGDGTLLDNTMVLYLNEFGASGTHTHDDIPYLVAGRCGGVLQPGQWLQYQGEPHNRLMLSMLRAFGIEDGSFGDPRLCTAGPLTELFS